MTTTRLPRGSEETKVDGKLKHAIYRKGDDCKLLYRTSFDEELHKAELNMVETHSALATRSTTSTSTTSTSTSTSTEAMSKSMSTSTEATSTSRSTLGTSTSRSTLGTSTSTSTLGTSTSTSTLGTSTSTSTEYYICADRLKIVHTMNKSSKYSGC